jgi:carbohydrate diacid regulator
MLQMDPVLAQAIVDRAMAIIDCNVNVMDARGTIIASGDPTRIGTLHEGALLVLSKQAPVEIGPDLARQLGGVRPGINLPLRAEQDIVGCLGLTGVPDEVRRYAELVRLAAETMLEQARLMRLLARDARLREELVLGLIRGEAVTPAQADWAARLGIDMTTPRVATVIEVESRGLAADTVLEELQRLHSLLTLPEHNNLVATVSLTELVVLKPALDGKGQWNPALQASRIETLLDRMSMGSALRLRIALGSFFAGSGGLARSYQLARTTLAVGKRRQPERRAFFYTDLRLPVLLEALRQDWRIGELREPLDRLVAGDRTGQLRKTVQAWFAQDMQSGRTAVCLGVHRNTLDYRMRRIEKLCGLDLTRTEDRMRLYLALEIGGAGDSL